MLLVAGIHGVSSDIMLTPESLSCMVSLRVCEPVCDVGSHHRSQYACHRSPPTLNIGLFILVFSCCLLGILRYSVDMQWVDWSAAVWCYCLLFYVPVGGWICVVVYLCSVYVSMCVVALHPFRSIARNRLSA